MSANTTARLTRYRPRNIGVIDFVMFLQMFLLCLFYSQSYNFFEQYRSLLFQTIFAIDVAFLVIALPFTPLAALSGLSIIGAIVFYQAIFSFNYGSDFTGAYVGTFPGLYASGLFAVHARRRGLSRALLLVYLATLAYVLLFLYLRHSINPYEVMKQQIAGGQGVSKGILRAHGSAAADSLRTEYRIKTSGFALAFAFIYPLAMFRRKGRIGQNLFLSLAIALAAYTLFIADFRVNLLSVIAAVLLGAMPFVGIIPKAALALAMSVISMAVCASLSVLGVNYFALLGSDENAIIRASEYSVAVTQFQRFPLFGIGLPSQGDDYQLAFGSSAVFPSDLGYFGELLQHGLVGMFLLILSHVIMFLFILRVKKRIGVGVESKVLLNSFVFTVFTEFFVTNMWEGGSTVLLSMAIAYLGGRYGFPPTRLRVSNLTDVGAKEIAIFP